MPDAWDDDWILQADSKNSTPNPPHSNSKLSKAERRAKQAEFNRQLWEDAEKQQEENYFLKTQGVVPLKTEFKPAVKVLSRKPAQTTSNENGMGQLSLDDDDDDEEAKKDVMTPEERKQKAQREREEKQRAYEERRRELFGKDDSAATSVAGKKLGSPRNQSRSNRGVDSRPSSSASSKIRQLFDPGESTKPENLRPPRKEPSSQEIRPIREPRAPETNGRGGFGFAPRGGHVA